MSFLYDLFGMRDKKRCSVCGCLMEPDSEFDMCECCFDDLLDYTPGGKE